VLQRTIVYLSNHDRPFYILIGLLLLPALLINLGLQSCIDDETIRGLVALEMIYSGDYITPTVAGELYFNKPPAYNWLIVLFSKISGNTDELTLRLVVIFSLLFYSVSIWFFTRRHLGNRNAVILALLFITCGRILFYDSYYGLIDIAYSALVYTSFMSIWYFLNKQKYILLFLVSYCLAAITFLMKGLPSIYYQGITLIVAFILAKKFRKIFSWQHLAGIILFCGILGAYYYAYLLKNPGNLDNIFRILISESTQKSALGHEITRTIKHMVTFPFVFIYHFLPWTIMAIYFIRRDIQKLIHNRFIQFNLYVFFFNILIYWFSPDTFARYLLVHVPLIYTVILYLHNIHEDEKTVHFRIINIIFLLFALIILVTPVIYPIHPLTRGEQWEYFKAGMLFAGLVILLLLLFKLEKQRLLILVAILLVSRIGFNWFVMPSRERTDYRAICRDEAIAVGKGTKGRDLYLVWGTPSVPHSLYYISREREAQLTWTHDISDPDALYVIHEASFEGPEYETLYEFHLKDYQILLQVVQFKHSKK